MFWAFVSYDEKRSTYVLREFHIEGFVNQYALTSMGNDPFVFVSEVIENIDPGWRAA